MSKLEKLQKIHTLTDFARLLGFKPNGLSYVLYTLADDKKYHTFEIPKKSGGTRIINAPEGRLALIQRRLGELLYDCVDELKSKNPRFWYASHGFQKGRTIVSNADVHRRRRFVFNVDIENFFGAINFGRVRGFFIKDKLFSLNPNIATLIAQIACHENALPQGSPCSPVISNLLGNILDMRLLALARDSHCTYTRYADDLTFSTNKTLFPTEIALNTHGADWEVGKKLKKEIVRTGFKLNDAKTRMSLKRSRQTVTGLVVNSKPNIKQDYYRNVRAMCNALFQKGEYHTDIGEGKETTNDLKSLEGMLSHIYFVKFRRDRDSDDNKRAIAAGEFFTPKAPKKLYQKFLHYKHFAAPCAPLIITEGVSDITYLKCSIRSLVAKFPTLASIENGKMNYSVNFFSPSDTARDVLNLGNGTGGQLLLVKSYGQILEKFKCKPLAHPVIILCDNDEGAKQVFGAASKKSDTNISIKTTDPYYHIVDNLYLVKVPEGSSPQERVIEDLFEQAVLSTLLDGKSFDQKKAHKASMAYGKELFAKGVVRPNWSTINFAHFAELLSRIEKCIEHYATLQSKASAVTPIASDAVDPS